VATIFVVVICLVSCSAWLR